MKPCFQHFQSWKGSLSLRFAPYPVNKSHVQQHEKYWWEVHILQFKAKSLLTGGLVLKASDLTGELSSHYWNNFTWLWFCLWDFLFLKLKQCTLIRTIKALKNVHKTYNVWFCSKSTKSICKASSTYLWINYHVPILVPIARDVTVNKTNKFPALEEEWGDRKGWCWMNVQMNKMYD